MGAASSTFRKSPLGSTLFIAREIAVENWVAQSLRALSVGLCNAVDQHESAAVVIHHNQSPPAGPDAGWAAYLYNYAAANGTPQCAVLGGFDNILRMIQAIEEITSKVASQEFDSYEALAANADVVAALAAAGGALISTPGVCEHPLRHTTLPNLACNTTPLDSLSQSGSFRVDDGGPVRSSWTLVPASAATPVIALPLALNDPFIGVATSQDWFGVDGPGDGRPQLGHVVAVAVTSQLYLDAMLATSAAAYGRAGDDYHTGVNETQANNGFERATFVNSTSAFVVSTRTGAVVGRRRADWLSPLLRIEDSTPIPSEIGCIEDIMGLVRVGGEDANVPCPTGGARASLCVPWVQSLSAAEGVYMEENGVGRPSYAPSCVHLGGSVFLGPAFEAGSTGVEHMVALTSPYWGNAVSSAVHAVKLQFDTNDVFPAYNTTVLTNARLARMGGPAALDKCPASSLVSTDTTELRGPHSFRKWLREGESQPSAIVSTFAICRFCAPEMSNGVVAMAAVESAVAPGYLPPTNYHTHDFYKPSVVALAEPPSAPAADTPEAVPPLVLVVVGGPDVLIQPQFEMGAAVVAAVVPTLVVWLTTMPFAFAVRGIAAAVSGLGKLAHPHAFCESLAVSEFSIARQHVRTRFASKHGKLAESGSDARPGSAAAASAASNNATAAPTAGAVEDEAAGEISRASGTPAATAGASGVFTGSIVGAGVAPTTAMEAVEILGDLPPTNDDRLEALLDRLEIPRSVLNDPRAIMDAVVPRLADAVAALRARGLPAGPLETLCSSFMSLVAANNHVEDLVDSFYRTGEVVRGRMTPFSGQLAAAAAGCGTAAPPAEGASDAVSESPPHSSAVAAVRKAIEALTDLASAGSRTGQAPPSLASDSVFEHQADVPLDRLVREAHMSVLCHRDMQKLVQMDPVERSDYADELRWYLLQSPLEQILGPDAIVTLAVDALNEAHNADIRGDGPGDSRCPALAALVETALIAELIDNHPAPPPPDIEQRRMRMGGGIHRAAALHGNAGAQELAEFQVGLSALWSEYDPTLAGVSDLRSYWPLDRPAAAHALPSAALPKGGALWAPNAAPARASTANGSVVRIAPLASALLSGPAADIAGASRSRLCESAVGGEYSSAALGSTMTAAMSQTGSLPADVADAGKALFEEALGLCPEIGVVPLLEGVVVRDAVRRLAFCLQTFSRYVPSCVVSDLLASSSEAAVGMRPADVTILVLDLASFTTLTENLTQEEILSVLTAAFEVFCTHINRRGGYVDKFAGDAVIAFWNAPSPCEHPQLRAVLTALACVESLRTLNADFAARGLPEIRIRIGIASGPVFVGNIGYSERFDFSVLGATVDRAHELEGLNKVAGTIICVDEVVRNASAAHILYRPLSAIEVDSGAAAAPAGPSGGVAGGSGDAAAAAPPPPDRGSGQTMRVYEPICHAPAVTPERVRFVQSYELCLSCLEWCMLPQAERAIERHVRLYPWDGAPAILNAHADALRAAFDATEAPATSSRPSDTARRPDAASAPTTARQRGPSVGPPSDDEFAFTAVRNRSLVETSDENSNLSDYNYSLSSPVPATLAPARPPLHVPSLPLRSGSAAHSIGPGGPAAARIRNQRGRAESLVVVTNPNVPNPLSARGAPARHRVAATLGRGRDDMSSAVFGPIEQDNAR